LPITPTKIKSKKKLGGGRKESKPRKMHGKGHSIAVNGYPSRGKKKKGESAKNLERAQREKLKSRGSLRVLYGGGN